MLEDLANRRLQCIKTGNFHFIPRLAHASLAQFCGSLNTQKDLLTRVDFVNAIVNKSTLTMNYLKSSSGKHL